MALLWRLYYGDGSTYSSDDGPPDSSPGWNVQVVVVPDARVGRKVIREFELYYFEDAAARWHGTKNVEAIIEKHCFRIAISGVSRGRWIGDAEFDAIVERAMTDPGFPRRSGNLPTGETPG